MSSVPFRRPDDVPAVRPAVRPAGYWPIPDGVDPILRYMWEPDPVFPPMTAADLFALVDLATERAHYGVFPATLYADIYEELWRRNPRKNRNITPVAIRKLEAQVYAQAWTPNNGDSLVFTWEGVMGDAQHRARFHQRLGVPWRTLVCIGADPRTMNKKNRGRPKTDAQCLKSNDIENATILTPALRLLWKYDNGRILHETYPHEQVIESLYASHPAEALARSAAWANRDNIEVLYTQGLAAFLHFTLARIDPDDAERFFNLIDVPANLPVNHPVLRLGDTLRQVGKGYPRYPERILWPAAVTIKAWNAFRTGVLVPRKYTWRVTPTSVDKRNNRPELAVYDHPGLEKFPVPV